MLKKRRTKALLSMIILITGINLEANRMNAGDVYYGANVEGAPRLAIFLERTREVAGHRSEDRGRTSFEFVFAISIENPAHVALC